jgi:hypothetical protein
VGPEAKPLLAAFPSGFSSRYMPMFLFGVQPALFGEKLTWLNKKRNRSLVPRWGSPFPRFIKAPIAFKILFPCPERVGFFSVFVYQIVQTGTQSRPDVGPIRSTFGGDGFLFWVLDVALAQGNEPFLLGSVARIRLQLLYTSIAFRVKSHRHLLEPGSSEKGKEKKH